MSHVSAAPQQSPCTTPHAKQADRKAHAERNGKNRCAGGFDEAGVTKLLLQGEPVIALAAQPLNEAEAAHVVNIIRRAKTGERSRGQRGLWHAACGTRRLQHGCVVHACCPHLDAGNGLLDGRGHVAVALQRHSFLLRLLFAALDSQILRSASPFCHHSHCHWRSLGAPGTMPPKDKAGKKEIQKKQKQVWSA